MIWLILCLVLGVAACIGIPFMFGYCLGHTIHGAANAIVDSKKEKKED